MHIVLSKMFFLIKLHYYLCQSRDTHMHKWVRLKWPLFSPGFHRFHQILSDNAEVLQYGFDIGEGIDRLAAHLHLPSWHLRRLQWWGKEWEAWRLQQPLLQLAAKRSHRARMRWDRYKWHLLRCKRIRNKIWQLFILYPQTAVYYLLTISYEEEFMTNEFSPLFTSSSQIHSDWASY